MADSNFEETDELDAPVTFLPMLSRPTLLCLQCVRELDRNAARFHRLYCKTRVQSGNVVNGKRLREGEKYVTADS